MKRILNLVLNKEAFYVTGTPEKMFELRKYSEWIKSRLYTSDGTKKEYDEVHICCGYRKDRAIKKFRYGGCGQAGECDWVFTNGLTFKTEIGDYIIHLQHLP